MRGNCCFCSEINFDLHFMESANDLNLATSSVHSARNDLVIASWEAFSLFNLEFNYGRQNGT